MVATGGKKGKTSWTSFVMKIKKQENLPSLKEAMKRASERKSEWKHGGDGDVVEEKVEMDQVETPVETMSEAEAPAEVMEQVEVQSEAPAEVMEKTDEYVGGRRRGRSARRSRGRGRTARRSRGRGRARGRTARRTRGRGRARGRTARRS